MLTLICKPESGERCGFKKHLAHPMSDLRMKLHWPDVIDIVKLGHCRLAGRRGQAMGANLPDSSHDFCPLVYP